MFHSLLLAVALIAPEPGYYTALATHLKRWLGEENIPAQVLTAREMPAALAKEKIAFLVGFENPTPSDLVALKAFRQRGGKLVVFHSASKALGELMGVQPVGYAAAAYPGAWSKMTFNTQYPVGLPKTISQTSGVLNRIRPVSGKSRILAMWLDRSGRSSGEPAWIASDAGYWMSHVLLPDGDEAGKAQFLGALVGAVDAKLWNPTLHANRVAARRRAWRDLAVRQVPRAGEIHAVWDHTGQGLYPGDWPRTMHVLREARVTDLFVNVAGAGFAHYPSAVLPRSKTVQTEGDQLAKCLAAAKGTGIRVHAWILCFSATRATPAQLTSFAQKGWCLKLASGKSTEYLNPSLPAVRAHVLAAIDEIQRTYPIAGIHLDFVRWGDGTVKPQNASQFITQFVAEARRRVKRPKWLTTAVYGKYPQCVSTVGQDWERWLDMNLVDYCVPMNYTDSTATLDSLLSAQARSRSRAQKIIVGLGVTANESRLDATGVINQINLSRKYAFAGNALFDLDNHLETNILPYLKLGIW